MMMVRKNALLIIYIFFCKAILAQTVLVEGTIFLDGQSNHANIDANFERIAPSPLSYTLSTDSAGYFYQEIETGVYNITYTKSGFIDKEFEEVFLYSDTLFTEQTLLEAGLMGEISGVLTTGIYRITGDLTIPENDTLRIQPGTTLLFERNTRFYANGSLIAIGKKDSAIKMICAIPNYTWKGLILGPLAPAYPAHNLTYVHVSQSNLTGVTIKGKSFLNHCIISNNGPTSTPRQNEGGGIYIDRINGNIIVANCEIYNNRAGHGGGVFITRKTPSGEESFAGRSILANCMIRNNTAEIGSGIVCLVENGLHDINPLILNNTIVNNNIVGNNFYGTVMISNQEQDGGFINNIVAFNKGAGVMFFNNDNYTYMHNNVYNNTFGNYYNEGGIIGTSVATNRNGDVCDPYYNMQLDPLFEDRSQSNYQLLPNSPCIDAGLNDAVNTSEDINLETRILDGNNLGVAYVDIGSFEHRRDTTSSILARNATPAQFICYPNPGNEIIHIESLGSKIKFIEIYDVSGKLIKSIVDTDSTSATININELKNGMYFIKLTSVDESSQTVQFVKEK